MIKFSMLLINNNRSKAYLQNLILNGFIPENIIVLDDKNIVLPEHTENDEFITQNTKQILIRKVDKLKLEFDEKEHIISTITKNNIKDNRWTSSDLETIKSVIKARTIIPKMTGTVTATNIFNAILSIDISLTISMPRKPAEL